jgi:predicted permease
MILLRDLRYGVRILARNPPFAVAAVTLIALGIAATTAVFSVIRGVLLTPLPYGDPHRIVLFRADLPGFANQAALNREELFALRDRPDLFESVAVINESEGNLTEPDRMAAVTAVSASDNFLDTLGVAPLLGRPVTNRDIGERWVNAVVISDEAWHRHFNGDPQIVGRRIEVNNLPMTVAGVMPRGFRLYLGSGVPLPTRVDIWYPRGPGYDIDPFRGRVVIARLRAGVTLEAARAAVDAIARNLVAQHPAEYTGGALRLSLAPIDQDVVSTVKPALVAVSGAVAFVLLVACANLANLLLVRASARTRELALRVSIGASRAQVVRQLAVEGLVVGVPGAAAGLLLALWGVDALLLVAPSTLPLREAIEVDGAVAFFAMALSVTTAAAVSLVPALIATKSDIAGMLKDDPVSSRVAGTTRGLLLASQLALSLILLVGAGLMMRAFISMRSVPLGFDPDRVLTMGIALQGGRFGSGTLEEARIKRLAFYQQLAETVRQIPGVERAGVGLPLPLTGMTMNQRFSTGPNEPERQAESFIALAGYLETLRVPIVAGRYFTASDDNRPAVIIDERLAMELWPGQSAIGRQLLLLRSVGPATSVEVVGVVGRVQAQGLRDQDLPQIWMTYATRSYAGLSLVVRAANALALAPIVERTVYALGTGRPVHDVRMLEEYVSDASADTQFALFVLGVFAALAVVLTAVGVYGVVAYATARRTREIAVRLALGADDWRIVGLMLRGSMAWTAAGLAAGVIGALLLTRYLETLLFGVTPEDPATFVGVAALLTLIAMAATLLPGIRAVRTDPMLALRSE